MAKLKKLSAAPIEPEGELFGIATTLQPHKLVYFLNKKLFFAFKSIEDLPSGNLKSEQTVLFSVFAHQDTELITDFYLIGNFNGDSYLFSAQKQFQFIFFIQGAAHQTHIDSIVQQIRKIEGVQMVYRLQTQNIKEIEYFNEDFEMFLLDLKQKTAAKNVGFTE